MTSCYSGPRNRKQDNSALEKVTDHVVTRFVTRLAVVAGFPLVAWALDRFADQVDENARAARALSDSQIVLVQQQKQLVRTFDGFKETLDHVEADVATINDRVIRLETLREVDRP